MKIAAISDIHGDLRSLELVWSDIVARGLDQQVVINAGDTVAYGSDSQGCVDFARDPACKIVSVAGNYDVNVARFPSREDDYRAKWGKKRPAKFRALQDASNQINEDARQWLKALPKIEHVEIEKSRITISHYSPNGEKEPISIFLSNGMLRAIAAEVEDTTDIAVIGHTHTPFVRQSGSVLFINPGSVGRSFGSPTYAEIEVVEGSAPQARIITCRATQP